MRPNRRAAKVRSNKRTKAVGVVTRPAPHGTRARTANTSDRLARLYATLSATNEAILRTRSPEALFQGVCNAVVQGGKFVGASVRVPERDTGRLLRVASAGRLMDTTGEIRVSVDAATPSGLGLARPVPLGRPTRSGGKPYPAQYRKKRP